MDIENIEIMKPNGIYFDNAATSLMPKEVLLEMEKFYSTFKSNIGRSAHDLGIFVTSEVEIVRNKIENFLGAKDFYVIFTFNSTFASNLLALSYKNKIEKIAISVEEHNSSYLPWYNKAKKYGAIIDFLPLKNWEIEYNEEYYDVAVITNVSNVIGKINKIKRIADFMIVDGAQIVGHKKVKLGKEIDAFYFSSHKALGPFGTGSLLIRKDKIDLLEPQYLGGGSISELSKKGYKLREPPYSFEPGTPPIAEIIGMGKAIDLLVKNIKDIESKEKELVKHMNEVLEDLGVEYHGDFKDKEKLPIFSFNIPGLHYSTVGSILNDNKIYVRTGHHCAHLLMEYLGIKGSVRASLHFYNTTEEIEKFYNVLKKLVK